MTKHHTYTTDLSRLLDGICPVPAVLDTRIHGLQIDSRQVKTGDLFIALSGENYSAQDHLQEAIEKGANAVLVEGNVLNGKVHESGQAIELYLPNLRKVVGRLASRFFQKPANDLKVIGVTGTNGKTSVSHYIAQLLQLNGFKTGVIGTLGYGFPFSDSGLSALERTTPSVIDVHRYLAEMRDSSADCVAMEVSSHGLDQGRVDEVLFEGAVFTNLTRDHLDYHGSMEEYGRAKRKLFERPGLKFAVLNIADPYSETILSALDPSVEVIGYSIKGESRSGSVFNNCSLILAEPKPMDLGIYAEINMPEGRFELRSDLIGRFNLSNLMAAMGVCTGLGGSLEKLEQASEIRPVRGRMEMIRKPGFAAVVVDYAHTPDALENLLEAVRPYCQGQLHLMFGCGGDRDPGKRAEMAKIADKLADHIVLTDDNPRTEDPKAIVEDILKGFASERGVEVIHGRATAIENLLRTAKPDDIVVLAGKGHESYQEIDHKRIDFSDIEVARKAMDASPDEEQGAVCD
ncbi:MAG: UDP-N-acetylmuramoyl-L-alanyl-D-glutamate--2,6-diaminopimelate ligase [Oleiphilus sp.]|nr:MAG: UDP-N-acetylmuramoyl-L-alanyl-D-glutamate--2,6-diaminopimelate ligase [Oleiphilus sp.]